MKKVCFLVILVFGLLAGGSQAFATEEFSVTLADGSVQKVVLPDGMTFQQGFLEMAKLYLEERKGHENTRKNLDKLIFEAVAPFKEKVGVLIRDYDNLNLKYKNLIQLYADQAKPKPFRWYLFGTYNHPVSSSANASFSVSPVLSIFDTILIGPTISTEPTLGLMVGYAF